MTSAKSTKTMDKITAAIGGKAELAPLFLGPEAEINIFIHGYRAVSGSDQFQKLARFVLAAQPPGKVYLLFWKSGDWKLPVLSQTVLTLGRVAWRLFRRGRIFSPVSLLANAAMFAAGEIASFSYFERQSEKLGRQLKSYLDSIPGIKSMPLNLIGHSFGARVIHFGLGHEDLRGYRIKDVILLGGAADVHSDTWERCLAQIDGTLYNAYSKKDLALQLTPDLRKRVGRHPLPLDSDRVVNRHYPSFGHTDYWPRLGYILDRLWTGFKPSPNVMIDPPDSQ